MIEIYKTVIADHTVLINYQYSSIGCAYPRLFFKIKNEYINFDITLGALFKMLEKDFNGWLEDAKPISKSETERRFKEIGVRYDLFSNTLIGDNN